ncbi:hypothetical protein BAS06_09705 [Elizabethkingia miricola]|nr:hypothetical protein BAS06_09705 [Elizabethkingia miricola]
MPNGRYKGQKLINEVSTNAMAKIPKMIAIIPEMVFVKYKTPITIAMSMRIALSIVPIFFFISDLFVVY